MKAKLAVLSAAALFMTAPAFAHISIWPRDSMVGATEKYTLRVPNENKMPSTSVELDVPEGIVVETLAMPGNWKYELKKTGDKITGIVWQVNIPPAEFVELSFIARNPGATVKQVVWGIRQKFSDGHTEDMTKGADGKVRVPATTNMTPRPQ